MSRVGAEVGTRFIGRYLAEEFLAAEYDVTLFNRGRHPNPFADRDGVEQVRERDRVLVPGDGTNVHHLVAVGNVASAIRTVAEEGDAGEAYNVGDRRVLPLGETIRLIADALATDVEIVTTSARELAQGDLQPDDFPLYNPTPHVLSTEKLASLG